MPSSLRFQLPIDSHKVTPRPTKKPRMSLSQTYYIASTARVKLGKEAVKPDHNLRRLVGHANLLDSLMVELRDAERQQEAWFNKSVAKANDDEDRHFQYSDAILEEDEDSDSDFDESEYEMATSSIRSIKSSAVILSSEEDEIFEDMDDLPELALTRTSSHPPELVHDSDSDDESPPASPPQAVIEFSSSKALPVLHSGHKPQQTVVIETTPLIEAY